MITGHFDITEAAVRAKAEGDKVTIITPHAQVDVALSDAGGNGLRVEVQINTDRNGRTIAIEDGFIYT